jgi:hypothetical protein
MNRECHETGDIHAFRIDRISGGCVAAAILPQTEPWFILG